MGTKAMLAENIWISVTPAFDEMFIFLLCPYFPTYSCSALHDTRILSALVPITEISCCSVQCPQNGKETSFSKYQSQVSLTRTVADHRQAVLKYCECTCVGDVSSVPIASENYTDVMVLGFPTYLTTYYCSSLYTTTLLGPFIFPCPLVQFTHGKKGFKSKKNWSFSHVPVHVELKSVLHEIKSQLNITTTDYRGAPFRKGLSFKVSMNKQHKSSQSHIIKTKGIVQSPSSASTSRGVTFCYHTKSKFSRRNFKSWLLTTVQRTGYNRLRDIIHKDWHIIFGLVPVRGVTLTANQKKVAKAVFKVAKSMKSLPKYVLNNLCDLDEVVYGVHRDKVAKQGNQDQHNSTRGKKKQSKKEKFASNSTKDGAVKPLAGVQGIDSDYNTVTTAALTSEEEGKYGSSAHASSHGRGNERRHTSRKQTKNDSVQVALEGNPGVEKPTRSEDVLSAGVEHTEPLTLSRQSSKIEGYHRQRSKHDIPVEEESTYTSVLGFANTSSSLDVIQSHMTTYSKCCPRHDIQNTIVSGTTVPASDAFGPKRRYSSIKDIKDDPRHGNFDSSKSLTRIRRMNGSNYVYQERHHVMSDGPMPETVRRNRAANLHLDTDPTLSHQITSPLQPLHPVVPLSRQQDPSVNLPLHSQRQQTAHSESSSKLRREDTTETEPEKLEPTRRYGVTPTASSVRCSTQSSRADNSLQSHLAPDDHKERLKSTAELLHAQDYARILPLAYDGQPPTYFPSEVRIPYIFIAGLAYYKMSNHKKSVQYFQQCRRLAEECGRDGDVTICNIYMGDIDFAQRNYTEAAGRYQTALHYYSRDSVAKDFRMILPTKSAVWAKCGSAFKNASRVGDAVAAYERAIEVSSSKKDKLSAHTSLGNLFQGIGENERAVKEYESAIDLATELGDDVSLGWNHGNLGNALLGLHLRDKALHHLFKALDMAVDYETTPQAIGRAYNNLGTAYQSLNELDKAEEYYDFALAQAIYGNDISGQARVYGNIGNLQMLNKQYDRAVPHYTEVMRLSQDKATITTAHHNRGCAYYDWAEKKKKNAVTLRSAPKSSSMFKISLHGPEFERCKEKYRPLRVPESVQKYYLQGTRDLEYVIKHHEENLHGIQGSPKGLSLSVSLFETNSRTFHRMQDCLIHLQKAECRRSRFEDALLVAEQSRARTLGELLLKRRGPQLQHQLQSPPTLDQLNIIVSRQSSPVVYLSYTGERVLGWLLYPTSSSECSLNMFEVPLSDNEFDGKSFDYHLQYSLNEQLVERSFEMYKPFDDSDKSKTEPVEKLYDLVGKPVMAMLKELDKQHQEKDDTKESRKDKVRKIVIVPDSYTNLLPFTCVLNRKTGKFWGDSFYFQIMPSLLTMGILDQLPAVSVAIPVQHQQMLCVVGNPTIPPFKYNNDQWDLGKLPHATKEAEWVSHILKCNPILHEQATKDAVMMRIMNAKVIHLATHGSAVAGFLAFAGMSASSTEVVDAKKVLIYPEEIESLNISPALVVLSSCDSGRGVFKADGIQGMARAFILAGAQAVLTTLWRVPDESACIFMQFFYQYLVDGMKGTEALHKAILCLRCFSKYSQYIHWSGYQLTGREFQFDVSVSSARAELTTRLGQSSVFPRLDILKGLETAFMNNPRLPTDVQVLHGPPGVKPSEPLVDFIHCHHLHFTGGIFWINCRTPQLIDASFSHIKTALGLKELTDIPDIETQPSLVVLDSLDKIPKDDTQLLTFLKRSSLHIVIISKSANATDALQKAIDHELIRGTSVIDVQPLSTIHSTQKLVHSALKNHHLAPSRKEQEVFGKLAEFTTGSPPILDLTSALLDHTLKQSDCSTEEALNEFAEQVQLMKLPQLKPTSFPRDTVCQPQEQFAHIACRDISREVYETIKTKDEDVFITSAEYDSWQVVTVLIRHCKMTPEEQLLLYCLSSFNCCPIPTSYVTELATIITKASHQPHLASSLHNKLASNKLLKVYPKPAVYHPKLAPSDDDNGHFVYVPRFISAAVWKDMMCDVDKVMALSTCFKALSKAQPPPHEAYFYVGLGSVLVESYELHFRLVGKRCFQEVYTVFLSSHQSILDNKVESER